MKKSQSWNIFRYFFFLIKLPHLRLVQLAAAAFTALNRHLCRRVLLKPLFQSGHHAGRSDLKGVKIKVDCSGSLCIAIVLQATASFKSSLWGMRRGLELVLPLPQHCPISKKFAQDQRRSALQTRSN